jgi:NOL1/NOP2/fmu family ribosome biogenesis protein
LLKDPERGHLLAFFRHRFGISQTVFSNYDLYRRRRVVWVFTKSDRLKDLASLQVKSVGLPLLRWVGTHLKPTSVALQLFGVHADKNIVSLPTEQLRDLAERGEIKSEFPSSPGYVIVSSKSVVIGCALYLSGRLISQFPRYMFTSQTWEYALQEKKIGNGS